MLELLCVSLMLTYQVVVLNVNVHLGLFHYYCHYRSTNVLTDVVAYIITNKFD